MNYDIEYFCFGSYKIYDYFFMQSALSVIPLFLVFSTMDFTDNVFSIFKLWCNRKYIFDFHSVKR